MSRGPIQAPRPRRRLAVACAALLALASVATPAAAQAPAATPAPDPLDLKPAEADPLALQPTEADKGTASASPGTGASPLRLALEAGAARVDLRTAGDDTVGILSIDARLDTRLDRAWRLVLSNRFDHTDPALPGRRRSVNSLREAFLGWQDPEGSTAADMGRINHRQGPAYGFNPTDYFRHGALRSVTTADPVALRERRQGTVMLRASRLWDHGGITVALAPELDDTPSSRTFSLDLGSTNATHKALLTGNWRFDPTLSAQASVFLEHGRSAQWGASATKLFGDALVAYGELSVGKVPSLLERAGVASHSARRRAQAAAGVTYTFPSAFALTLEAAYNGHGLTEADHQRLLAAGPIAYARHAALTQGSQELGSRHAWLVYASQKGLGLKQLDFTAFVRANTVDDSRLWWAELRYHWAKVDGVLQWQRSTGRRDGEFGLLPVRQAVQASAVLYF
jgi:hypothetical protein